MHLLHSLQVTSTLAHNEQSRHGATLVPGCLGQTSRCDDKREIKEKKRNKRKEKKEKKRKEKGEREEEEKGG
jgi:hypothetical protein